MSEQQKITRNVQQVVKFIDAWGAVDVDATMACLSEDVVYINQPLEPVIGQRDVRQIVDGIMKLSKAVHWELKNCFGRGNVVVTNSILFDPKAEARKRAMIRKITDRP